MGHKINLENYLDEEEFIKIMKMKKPFRKFKNKFEKNKGWVVKNDRPEEYLGDPTIYYTNEEVERYSRSGGMRRAQERIAYRVLELLELEPESSLLDIGSGPGYTSEVYRSEGYNVTCIDLIPAMVEKAKEKGFEAYEGDMRKIKEIFINRKFDGAASVSALQWIKDKQELQKVAQGIYSILNRGAPLIIQFYPKSEQELKETASVFTQNGFNGQTIIDWPEIPKNRTTYLVMKRN